MNGLTHLDEDGAARMVDVSAKATTAREAVASGRIAMSAEAAAAIAQGLVKKGDVLAVARVAGGRRDRRPRRRASRRLGGVLAVAVAGGRRWRADGRRPGLGRRRYRLRRRPRLDQRIVELRRLRRIEPPGVLYEHGLERLRRPRRGPRPRRFPQRLELLHQLAPQARARAFLCGAAAEL